jgi:hypothetical protein
MKCPTLILVVFFLFGQPLRLAAQKNIEAGINQYFELTHKADSLYDIEDYQNSILNFYLALKASGGKYLGINRYNMARAWVKLNNFDSAFFHLQGTAEKAKYNDYNNLISDKDLNPLHRDLRWSPLVELVKKNQIKSTSSLNQHLVKKLDSVYNDDQELRIKIDEIAKTEGWESERLKPLEKIQTLKDSINLLKVISIIDKYGWPGPEVVSVKGNTTIFLVIQHSDLSVQKKYLPLMREAVKNGNAIASDLGLLEDRVALRVGKKQIYGSQIGRDPKTKKNYVLPLMDPDNVDKRRAEIGLPPLAEYINQWGLIWNVEQYKLELPKIESLQKPQ